MFGLLKNIFFLGWLWGWRYLTTEGTESTENGFGFGYIYI